MRRKGIDRSASPALSRERAGRISSAGEALRAIPDGSRVFVSSACSTPFALLESLAEEHAHFEQLEIVVGHLRRPLPLFARAGKPFRFTTLHASDVFDDLWGTGLVDVLPCRYSDYGRLFTGDGAYPVDAALVQVSPPGPDGRVSLGVSVGSTLALVIGAPVVIAQMNPRMPYTFGAGELPLEAFDFLVEAEEPIQEVPPGAADDTVRAIAAHAAGEIPDGATLQFGIGAVPDAILKALSGHRDLGLHGGMLGDACIDLVESGALDGSRKTVDRGSLVAAEVIGTRRLYDWVDRNPALRMAASSDSHGAAALDACPDFVAINSAIEVALDGAVNAESIGARLVSGPGGQPDFAIGASLSASHRSILAFPSTAARGSVSRIVAWLDPAATTTLPRFLADRIVTEFGVARLRGLPLRARAEALLRIAHPDFRDALSQAWRAGSEGPR
jgi:4-hydroxybutyrate CoA-transferase